MFRKYTTVTTSATVVLILNWNDVNRESSSIQNFLNCILKWHLYRYPLRNALNRRRWKV